MNSSEQDYAGMTVNERLASSRLLGAWDHALRNGDRQAAIDVLGRVELADQAATIVDTILGNPARYGFPPNR